MSLTYPSSNGRHFHSKVSLYFSVIDLKENVLGLLIMHRGKRRPGQQRRAESSLAASQVSADEPMWKHCVPPSGALQASSLTILT